MAKGGKEGSEIVGLRVSMGGVFSSKNPWTREIYESLKGAGAEGVTANNSEVSLWCHCPGYTEGCVYQCPLRNILQGKCGEIHASCPGGKREFAPSH